MKKYDVLAVGELNVDMILTGLKSMPVAGKEIIAEDFSLALGSSTAICASGTAKLGLKTGFHGKVGNDQFGDTVLRFLKENMIGTSEVIIDENIATGVTISLSMQKDRALVTYLGSIESLKFEDINLELLDSTRHIHVGSFFLQNTLRPDLQKLFEAARGKGISISLDAGWDDSGNWNYGIKEVLGNTDIFFPNETEALHITGKENIHSAVDELAQYSKTVVVKCGPKGAIGKWGDKIIEMPAFNELKPIDTTGAGDSFNAGFIYGFLSGFNFEKCMLYGNACGSLSVTKKGGASACASLEEVENLIEKYG